MSWSVSCIGKPEAVAAYLDEKSASLSGQNKAEFDDILPHLKGIVLQNFVSPDAPGGDYVCPSVDLEASGSGYSVGGLQAQRSAKVSLEFHYKKLV